MIKFFRRIRQNLIMENKTGKYLKYAIGEIVLVMIGILLALQVNNWNEQRKAKIKSYGYLQRLSEDIEIILEDVDNSIKGTGKNLNNSIIVKNALETKVLSDSNQKYFDQYLNEYHQYYMTLSNSHTYNEMISAGELNLIENRWIRDVFSNLFEYRDFIMEVNRSYHDSEILKTDEFQKHVRYEIKYPGTDSSLVIPSYHFESMTTDASLINKISRQSLAWNGILKMFKGYNSLVLQIKDSINTELKKIE